MSNASNRRSEEFLKISGQFKLGALVTEASHPVTATLSEPRMKSDQACPPVVAMAVMRARHGLTNEEAEKELDEDAKLNKQV